MHQGIILFADNAHEFLDTRAEFLEDEGYRVLKAYSLEQARQRLATDYVHLAILDIRLVDDSDEKDTSGLTLAKDPAFRRVPKVIITDYPTYDAVREALGPALDGLPPAVAFLAKREGHEAMIGAVKAALAAHDRSHRELDLQCDAQRGVSFPYLAGLARPGLPGETLVQRADELEDLLRDLFRGYEQARLLYPFYWGDGRFCLPAWARSPQGATDGRVVVCGDHQRLTGELERLRELAPEAPAAARLCGRAETLHYAAAAYALPNANLETVRPLRELLDEGKERPLRTAFRHLLTEVLPAWHRRGSTAVHDDLMALYRRQAGLDEGEAFRAEVERRVEGAVQMMRSNYPVQVERDPARLVFHFPQEQPLVCPAPVAAAYSPLPGHERPVSCCISPGRLTADDILVDGAHWPWLTDFSRAGQAPRWWDFVQLEAVVRFFLTESPDLPTCALFEERLSRPSRLDGSLDMPGLNVPAELKARGLLIEQIRHQAGAEATHDSLPYDAGLLVWAVAALADYDPAAVSTPEEKLRAAHLLLAAGMLARRLAQHGLAAAEASAPGGALRLDPDGIQVYRGDQPLPTLGPQELALFRYLYNRPNQVVSRQAVIDKGLGERYDAGDKSQDDRLTALVHRLRAKIEPNPHHPRYLITARGGGLKLSLSGE